VETATGQKLGGQAAQAVYEITVTKEYAKVNDFKGTIIVASGITAKVGDLALVDSMEGTYVWTHSEEACPKTLIQLQWARLLRIANPNFGDFKIYITFDTDVPESSGFFCLEDLG
jgi:hypothetical protein